MEGRQRLKSATISTVAVLLGVCHVIWPDIQIDIVTIILIVIALIPWLGSIFKSIEITDWFKVEYRERLSQVESHVAQERGRVTALTERLANVERAFVFSGTPAPSWVQNDLTEALNAYANFLERLGLQWAGPLPEIEIRDASSGASGSYRILSNTIFVAVKLPELSADITGALTGFTFRQIWDAKGPGAADFADIDFDAIATAISSYLPTSYLNSDRAKRVGLHDSGDRIHRITKMRRFGPPNSFDDHGAAWQSAFWEIRSRLGADPADRLVVDAWLAPPMRPRMSESFLASLCAGPDGEMIGAMFTERGHLRHRE
jgi:hypothetical protein